MLENVSEDEIDEIKKELWRTQPEIRKAAKEASFDLLPAKSRELYSAAYEKFKSWKRATNSITSENCLIVYFNDLHKIYAPTSLWAIHSMLKTMIKANENIDIGDFKKLLGILKNYRAGYKPKKARTFTEEQIQEFLENAPDEIYLAAKVILIMGICGCCRKDEIYRMKVQDIEKQGELLLVRVPNTKTGVSRAFTISQEFVPYVNKYSALRPSHATAKNFLMNYQKGKCTIQVIGKNKIAKIPLKIASFLHLENPGEFTGHSFRRSSATMFPNSGANMLELQRFGGWQSETVPRGYIDDSNVNHQNNATKISKMVDLNNTANSNGIKIEENFEVNEPPRKKLATEKNSLTINVPLDKHLNINNCSPTYYKRVGS